MQVRMPVIVLSAMLLSACASNKAPETSQNLLTKEPGKLDVLYTTSLPDGSYLNEVPTEVTIVKRRTTQKYVAEQIGLNVLMFAALGGGGTINTFSKDDLKGEKIEGVANRQNLVNPIPKQFTDELQHKVAAIIESDAALSAKAGKKELMVEGGSTRLIYEKLEGKDEETFRLKTELYVQAKKKKVLFYFHAPKVVTCSADSSDLLTQAQWAEHDYELVKTTLDTTLQECEKKVVAQLSTLLED